MLEDRIKQYTEEHAYNEEARGKLGQLLADLPISGYGRFEFYRPEEGWGVEICWHTPSNVIFALHALAPHRCVEDCDYPCEETWDRKSLSANALISALIQSFIKRTTELEKGTLVLNTAIAMFGRPRVGIGQLKAAVRAYEGKCHCGKIAAKDSDEALCEEHLAEWRKQMSEDIYLQGERSSYAYLGDWRAVAP